MQWHDDSAVMLRWSDLKGRRHPRHRCYGACDCRISRATDTSAIARSRVRKHSHRTAAWVDSYPNPGQARAVQIDLKPEHLGIRYPVEVPLVADVKATVAALLPLLQPKDDSFIKEAQNRMRDWRALLDRVCATARMPLRPQMVMRELSNQLAPGLPFAIAAQLAFPSRQSVAVVGDGGFTQLMGELVTAVKYQLPIKIIILKNNSLAEVPTASDALTRPK